MVSHEYFSAQVRGFFILIIPKDEGFHFIDFKLLTADNFGGVLLKLKRTRNEAIRLYCRIGFCFLTVIITTKADEGMWLLNNLPKDYLKKHTTLMLLINGLSMSRKVLLACRIVRRLLFPVTA